MNSVFSIFRLFDVHRVPSWGPESTQTIEYRTADGFYFMTADGKYYGTAS